MRRILYAALSTVAGLVLLVGVKTYGSPSAHSSTAGTARDTGATGTGRADGSSGTHNSSGSDGTTAKGKASGTPRTVAGQTVDTPYGPVQVEVRLSAAKILDVNALRLPDGNQRDIEIARYAIPQLRQEALDAQSAQIDTVSGATYTSEGYIRSLQSALDQSGG